MSLVPKLARPMSSRRLFSDFDYCSVAGFEANGGFLLGSDVHFNQHTIHALRATRDALLPGLLLLADACAQQTTISQLDMQC